MKTGAFSALLAPGLRHIFFEKYSAYPDEHAQVFNIGTSERAYEEDTKLAGLGVIIKKGEGEATTFQDPIMGALRRYTHSAFSLGFRVTREMYDDDLYDVVKRMASALGRSVHQGIQVNAFDVINNGFVTTNNVGFDSLALFSTAHTVLQGGTQSNRPTVDADLSVTSLQAAVENFEKFGFGLLGFIW